MSENILPFSSTDYDKLDRKVFPTIRRRDKYGDIGTINEIRAGRRGNRDSLGKAEIIAKETITIEEIRGPFFQWDTNVDDDKLAYESINRFYQNPIEKDEPLTLYWNRWVE